MRAITIYDAGLLLAKELCWNRETTDDQVVTYDMFWRFCIMSKLTCSERTIRELWRGFIKLGVAKKVNAQAVRFSMDGFRTLMAVEFTQWRAP